MSTAFTAPTSDGTAFFCSKECRDAFQSGPRANKRWPDSTAVRN
jgi:YHS domain-containing protein